MHENQIDPSSGTSPIEDHSCALPWTPSHICVHLHCLSLIQQGAEDLDCPYHWQAGHIPVLQDMSVNFDVAPSHRFGIKLHP